MIDLVAYVGNAIRAERTDRRISQRALAEAAGLSQESSIANYENFRACPSVRALCRIAQALDVEPGDLLPTITAMDDAGGKVRAAEGRSNEKITQEDADTIRNLYATGKYSFRRLAELYPISPSQVDKIVNWEAWK